MLQRFVANWLRQQATEAVMNAINPDSEQQADGQSGESESVPAEVDVVCLFPSSSEAGGFVDKLSDITTTKCSGFVERIGVLQKTPVAVVESGLAHEKLARALRDVIELRKPKWVLSNGFAMALAGPVRRGDIIVADRIVDPHEYSLEIGTKMPEAKGLRVGTLLTVEMFPEEAKKQKEFAGTNALACDTQAAVIAEVCRVLKTRMMAVHVVAQRESVTSTLVKKVKSQESMAGLLGAAAGALIEKPSTVKDFWNDKESSLKLSDRLAHFLEGVVGQLS